MGIYELWQKWTKEERKQAVASMRLDMQAELASALLGAGFSASALRRASFSASALRRAGFSASALRRAGFSASALLDAGLSASALRGAGFSASEVLGAGFSASALLGAGFSALALLGAGLSASEVRGAGPKKDIQEKAKKMGRDEAEFVVRELKLGLMNGQAYGSLTECGCYLGSAAKKAKMSVDDFCQARGIEKKPSSPAEQWFMNVGIGDTPENNHAAKMGLEWIKEALAEMAAEESKGVK